MVLSDAVTKSITILQALYNADGTLNKTVLVALVSAILLLVQQQAQIMGLDLTGKIASAQDCINTVLTILTILGIVSVQKDGATNEK